MDTIDRNPSRSHARPLATHLLHPTQNEVEQLSQTLQTLLLSMIAPAAALTYIISVERRTKATPDQIPHAFEPPPARKLRRMPSGNGRSTSDLGHPGPDAILTYPVALARTFPLTLPPEISQGPDTPPPPTSSF